MATDTKRPAKTEVLSMRMDPKTRFLLEILARLRGQSISTVVERAILEAADHANFDNGDAGWKDYWHVSDGVRALKIAAVESLYPTYEEENRLAFAKTHWPFFYTSSSCNVPRIPYVDILWPKIDELLHTWEMTKSSNYFAAGKAMQQALRAAGVAAPDWPTQVEKPQPKKSVSADSPSWDKPSGSDLDDEIPF